MKITIRWPILFLLLVIALCGQTPHSPEQKSPSRGPESIIPGEKVQSFLEAEQYDSVLLYARKWVEASEKEGQWYDWGKAQIYLINSRYYLGQSSEAAASFPAIERSGQPHIHADSAFWGEYYNCAGAVFNQLGNYEEALRYSRLEIEFYEKKGDLNSFAIACNNAGSYYRGRGDYDRALEYTQSALQIFKSDPQADPADLAWTYGSLSKIWYRKKNYDQAIATAKEALSILDKHFAGERPLDFIVIYNDLANAFAELQEFDKARDYLHEALRTFKRNNLDDDIVTTWHNLGYVYRRMGRYAEAGYYLKKAVDGYGPSHSNLGKAYRHLGFIALQQGDLRGALSWQQKALRTLTDSFPDHDILANPSARRVNAYQDFLLTLRDKGEALSRLAEKESNRQFLEASLATHEIAMGLLDSMRVEYQEGSRQFWNEEARPIVEHAIAVAMRLYRQTGDGQYLEKSFGFAEKNKALLLAEALRDAAARQQAGIPDSILQLEKSLKINMAFYKRQIFREQQKGTPDTAKILLWHKNILEQRRANEALLAQLEKSYPEYYQIKYETPALSTAAVQRALPPGTALVQYYRGEKNLYAFYFDRTAARGLEIPVDSVFLQPLGQLLGLLRNRNLATEAGRSAEAIARLAGQSHRLYNTLMAQVVEKTPESLVVIPDGDLAYLPFELLVTSASPAASYADLPFLLKQTVVRYEYSASLALQPTLRRRPDYFFGGYAPAYPEASLSEVRGETTDCREAGLSTFTALGSNQAEVSQIARLMGGKSFLGAAATEPAFKQHASESKILHLAMHGFLNDCDPLYSGLVFDRQAFRDSADEATDGFLHTYEIYNLRLNADLAVLSACNTGSGRLAKGEGVISLARAFKYAGCPNVIMSLWQADDQATAQIMQDFYKYLKKGMGKDAALRQAKLDYLGTQSRSHPFYWGAFVLIGDDQPVQQPTRWAYFAAGILTLLLVGGSILLWLRRKRPR